MAAWTFVPIMAKEDLGIGNAAIGISVLLYSAALFLASYVFGRSSDIHGRRRYILGGLLLGTGAMAAVALVLHYIIKGRVEPAAPVSSE